MSLNPDIMQRKSVSGRSDVKYDSVPRDDAGQGVEGYGAVQLNITDTSHNPFTGAESFHPTPSSKAAAELNGKEYLQPSETSFSQAVSMLLYKVSL